MKTTIKPESKCQHKWNRLGICDICRFPLDKREPNKNEKDYMKNNGYTPESKGINKMLIGGEPKVLNAEELHEILSKPESKDCGCGKFTGKDSYDCNKNGARTKAGTCNCLCHIEWKKGRRIDRKKWDKKTYLTFKDRRLTQFKEHFKNNRERYYENTKLMNKKYPEKRKARLALSNAISKGEIKKLPCAFCGEIKVQCHHLNYENPLEIMWLCIKCHRLLHSLLRSEKKKAKLETLELISNDQGWEESRDIYAEKLGLPKKYNLKEGVNIPEIKNPYKDELLQIEAIEKLVLDKRNKEMIKIIDDESEKCANEMKDRESAYGINVFAQTIIDKILNKN